MQWRIAWGIDFSNSIDFPRNFLLLSVFTCLICLRYFHRKWSALYYPNTNTRQINIYSTFYFIKISIFPPYKYLLFSVSSTFPVPLCCFHTNKKWFLRPKCTWTRRTRVSGGFAFCVERSCILLQHWFQVDAQWQLDAIVLECADDGENLLAFAFWVNRREGTRVP